MNRRKALDICIYIALAGLSIWFAASVVERSQSLSTDSSAKSDSEVVYLPCRGTTDEESCGMHGVRDEFKLINDLAGTLLQSKTQMIDVGTGPDTATGDYLYVALRKIRANLQQILDDRNAQVGAFSSAPDPGFVEAGNENECGSQAHCSKADIDRWYGVIRRKTKP
jgi:hypothetical protein